MRKKKIVIALGHHALGTTLPEQKIAAAKTAKAIAGFVKEDYQIVIVWVYNDLCQYRGYIFIDPAI